MYSLDSKIFKDVIPLILEYVNVLKIREVCKSFHRCFKFSPYQIDRLCIKYIFNTDILSESDYREFCDPPTHSLLKLNDIDHTTHYGSYFSVETPEYRYTQELGKCYAYDLIRGEKINFSIHGQLMNSNNYLITEMTFINKYGYVYTFWKPGLPKRKVDIDKYSELVERDADGVEWGGFYFIKGNVIDIPLGKECRDPIENISNIDYWDGSVRFKLDGQWYTKSVKYAISHF